MTDAQIKHMVDRFLQWKLPENFNPDGGISFKKTFNENAPWGPMKHEPVGTNLFDAIQAEAMVRYMVDGLPAERGEPAAEPQPRCCNDPKCPYNAEPAAPAPAAPLEPKREHALILAALFEGLMAQDAPDALSGCDLFDAIIPEIEAYKQAELARLSAELEQVRQQLTESHESLQTAANTCASIGAELEQVRHVLNAIISHPAVREVLAPRESLGSLLAAAEAVLGEKGQ